VNDLELLRIAAAAADALTPKGGQLMAMRLPQVHDACRFGWINQHIVLARQTVRVVVFCPERANSPNAPLLL
jgi:hypothetical protein